MGIHAICCSDWIEQTDDTDDDIVTVDLSKLAQNSRRNPPIIAGHRGSI